MSEIVAVDPSVVQAATALKDEGNAFLSAAKYSLAVEKYTQAIELNPTAIFYSNRAQAYIKLEAYGQAIQDANDALKLDPKYIKAYYRRGSANYALGKLKGAVRDFKAVVTLVPKDPDAHAKLKICEKLLRTEAFNKAIESSTPEEAVDPLSIPLDSAYAGPVLGEQGEVTMGFAQQCMAYMQSQKTIAKRVVVQVLLAAIEMLKALPTLLELSIPEGEGSTAPAFTVCGDTHGQFYDLLNIFALNGLPSAGNAYLFNGDYVDRGSWSFETVFTLLVIKLALPGSLHLLRGNHETKNMNSIYGFRGEILHKYDATVMGLFARVFNALPLAAVLEKKVFIVHGGISTEGDTMKVSDIATLNRFHEPPEKGLMSDLLWSDPQDSNGRSPSQRGLGFSFGPDLTARFLAANNLDLMIRSHEVKQCGYAWQSRDEKCLTVFSAPNYCDQMGNKGAFVRFTKTDAGGYSKNIVPFDHVEHPNIPPMAYAGQNNFMGL